MAAQCEWTENTTKAPTKSRKGRIPNAASSFHVRFVGIHFVGPKRSKSVRCNKRIRFNMKCAQTDWLTTTQNILHAYKRPLIMFNLIGILADICVSFTQFFLGSLHFVLKSYGSSNAYWLALANCVRFIEVYRTNVCEPACNKRILDKNGGTIEIALT